MLKTALKTGLSAMTALVLMAMPVVAAELRTFDAAAFEAAQSSGTPIVVDITASWCPTCRAQKPTIEKLAQVPEFEDMIIFQVDFDDQKDVVRSLGASIQSTLIAFNGSRETARSVGDTDPASIETLFKSTLAD